MSKALPRSKVVQITIIDEQGQEKVELITVKKAGLGQWKQIISALKNLLNLLPEFLKSKGVENIEEFLDTLSYADLIALIPDILDMAAGEFITLLAVGTGLDIKYLDEKVGIDEAVELVEAILQVNNVFEAVEKGKNLVPRARPGLPIKQKSPGNKK